MGEVSVHVDFEGRAFTGKATSTDVVDASARAYLHAVNKVLHLMKSVRPAPEQEAQPLPRLSEVPAEAPRPAEPAPVPTVPGCAPPGRKATGSSG
jgi:hypothetical protein